MVTFRISRASKVYMEYPYVIETIPKGIIFNTSVSAYTNFFNSDLAPTFTPRIFRLYCCFNTSGVLIVRRTKGGTTINEQLNSGLVLVPNVAYIFDIIVDSGETINFQYSVDTTILKFSISEIGR
jgi:hypothetical protein